MLVDNHWMFTDGNHVLLSAEIKSNNQNNLSTDLEIIQVDRY